MRAVRVARARRSASGAALPLLGEALDDFIEHGITSHVLEAVAVGISIGRKDYFAANTTSFLLALGEYLEARIARRSDNMLCRLLMPAPDAVWVERCGREERLSPAELKTGDTVIAATGTVIAVDGTVLGGEALVNEATMTGESVPVMRRRGDAVLSGTMVEEGRLRIYAERVGAQAAVSRIAEFVQRSLTSKSDTQLAASRMADRLVPMVLALARQLGLDAFYADVLPEDKAAILEQMRAAGARVAFVGDGVNDAPALSCAHVGISMHRGAQIARMVSDIALLEDDIARVADARALAQGNRRRVNNNFRLTVGLNSAILTAAAFGWLRPVSASMLHNGSTIGILLHALLGAGAGCGAARAGDAAGVRGVTLRRAARCIL